ncbi:MAG: IclR family transcriptional regulator [Kiritimatiellae bacterium]|nr:IclR family transcriptional regulator [Kiritimatiellia bacterium]
MIRSLDKALRLVDLIADAAEGIGNNDLSRKIGLERTTVFRLLETLAMHNYVRRDPVTKKYALGNRILELSLMIRKGRRLQDISRSYLRKLARETGETAHLAVLNGDEIIIVDQEMGGHLIGVHTHVGMHEPIHCTALGKALLFRMNGNEIGEIIGGNRLQAYSKNTITTLDKLQQELVASRKRGYALDNEEYKQGVRCLAAPVLDHRGMVAAAIGISGLLKRLTKEKLDSFARIVKKTGENLSAQMGYCPENSNDA